MSRQQSDQAVEPAESHLSTPQVTHLDGHEPLGRKSRQQTFDSQM